MQLVKTQYPVLKVLFLLGLAVSLTQCAWQSVPVQSPPKLVVPEIRQPELTIRDWPENNTTLAQLYVVTIPPGYPLEIAVGEQLKTVEQFATETDAVAVLNGGFFDPNNAQTTSFVTIDGTLVADPRDNRRLMENPDLSIYLEQILNRSEFRRYTCGSDIRYDITFRKTSFPAGCTLHSALGAGPQLLPDTSQKEGFTSFADGRLIRDSIGSQQQNARSAIGIRPDGSLVWIMVSQTMSGDGMTLAELSEFMTTLNVQKLLNLDGGSSSSLYTSSLTHDGLAQGYYGRLDQTGQRIIRPVKSVLLIPGSDR